MPHGEVDPLQRIECRIADGVTERSQIKKCLFWGSNSETKMMKRQIGPPKRFGYPGMLIFLCYHAFFSIMSTNSPTFLRFPISDAENLTPKALETARTRRICVRLSQPS